MNGTPRLEDLGGGLYAYIQPDGSWMINNTGFLVAANGVVAVDSCSTERRTRAFLDTVRAVSAAPVHTLLNTHSHPDHTAGNGWFPGATIIAQKRTRAARNAPPLHDIFEPIDAGELPPAPPFLTYTDGITLWVDDLRCEVRYVGTPAHTTNDSILWVPERSVLYAGDLLFSGAARRTHDRPRTRPGLRRGDDRDDPRLPALRAGPRRRRRGRVPARGRAGVRPRRVRRVE